jgi:hypothetical protein
MSGAAMAAGALAPILGGYLGMEASAEDSRKSVANAGKIAGLYGNLQTPEYDTINPVSYGQYSYLGDYTPTTLEAVNLGPSAMEGIALDPVTRAAQMQALQQLQDVSSQGGMTAIDRARLAQMQTGVNQQERGNREAIMQNMRQRGVAGSGLELAASLSNQQSAADRANQEALNVEAMAQQRALDAMMQSGSLAGSIRGQDFGEQSQIAQAKDAISKFNAANTQDVRNQNWGAVNQAGMAGNTARQGIANANVDIGNKQVDTNTGIAQYGNDLKGMAFDDKLKKAGGIASGYGAASQAYGNRATSTRQTYAGIGQGIGQGMSAYGQYSK